MNLTAVCISDKKYDLGLPIPFYCHTEGYNPLIKGHDALSLERWRYLTDRYNAAVRMASMIHPETDHLLIVDTYYLRQVPGVSRLVQDYQSGTILGASIWYWSRFQILPAIRYYDTRSVNEFRDWKWRWLRTKNLPSGIIPVSGVGGCWILPRSVWESSGGFFIPEGEPQAGGSKCLHTGGVKVLLDCDARLWRTPDTNPGLKGYSWPKRIRVSLGRQKNKVLEAMALRVVPSSARSIGTSGRHYSRAQVPSKTI
jgi:hypothetical protein